MSGRATNRRRADARRGPDSGSDDSGSCLDSLDGARFRSVETDGDSFTGPDTGGLHWSVSFADGEVVYTQTDTGVVQPCACQAGECVVTVSTVDERGDFEYEGTIDP